MNCAIFQNIKPDINMPWFDSIPQANMGQFKIYNDGSHYVASFVSSGDRKKRKNRIKSSIDEYFDELYFQSLQIGLRGAEQYDFIKDNLGEYDSDSLNLDKYISERLLSKERNLYQRKKRFRRKAMLNKWNYFTTFTYNSDIMDEDSFRRKLKKCLSNLHTRHGWLYMGVFERAPETDRLHFHCLLYVPEGQMVGEIYERSDYSTKQHKMQVTHSNVFFENTFGRNDFESINSAELKRGNTIQYLLKYLEKTEDRIIYSRGIPTEFYKELDIDKDICCELIDFITKYVLFDDVIDYDSDVSPMRRRFDVSFRTASA